jgi:PAS domain S-box-containing protein
MSDSLFRGLSAAFSPVGQSITVADARKPDLPLIYANQGFEHFSGYRREEVIGRNCRFLQLQPNRNNRFIEPDADTAAALGVMRDAIANKRSCIVDLVNFKKNGERMVNRLSLRPVFDQNQALLYYIGLQSDVTAMKDVEENIVGYITKALRPGG